MLVWGFTFINKMFSQFFLLNTFSGRNSKGFKLKYIKVLVDGKEQPWLKQSHIEKSLGISQIYSSTAKLGQDDKQTCASLQAGPNPYTMKSGPKDKQNKTDNSLSLTLTLYAIVNSQKRKGKEHILMTLYQWF